MAGFPQNILIIDDDEFILEIMAKALQSAGDIKARACNSCEKAVEAVQNEIPDIAVLDLRMPGKNGPDTIEELRGIDGMEKVPFIFCTGDYEVEMKDEYRKIGVIGVIHKPFRPFEFVSQIQKLWQAHSYAADDS